MKKARIMLVVIAILGLFGAILAFKAKRFYSSSNLYATTLSPLGSCYLGPYTTTSNSVHVAVTLFTQTTTDDIGPYYGFDFILDKPIYCNAVGAYTSHVYVNLGE